MLYSLLWAVVILSIFNAVVVTYMVVRYFIKGYNIHAEKPILEPKLPKISRKEKRDEDRHARILKNIDNYTGDETGQVHVK